MISGVAIACVSADPMLAVLKLTPTLESPLPEDAELVGAIRGPYSQRSHTLPAEFRLTVDSPGVLKGQIIDPCYATDELPMEYVLELFVKSGSETLSEYKTRVTLQQKP